MGDKKGPAPEGIITSDAMHGRPRHWLVFAAITLVVATLAGISYYGYSSRPWTKLGLFSAGDSAKQIAPQGTPEEAIQKAQDKVASAKTPAQKSTAYQQLGDALISNNQASEAASSYQSAVTAADNTDQKSAALGDLVGVYILSGQTQQAIDAINQLIPVLQQSSSAEDRALVPRYQQLIIQLQAGKAPQ